MSSILTSGTKKQNRAAKSGCPFLFLIEVNDNDETAVGAHDPRKRIKKNSHYWFDFGDDWWHRIRVQGIRETPSKKKHVEMIKWVGESPPQYEGLDEDDE